MDPAPERNLIVAPESRYALWAVGARWVRIEAMKAEQRTRIMILLISRVKISRPLKRVEKVSDAAVKRDPDPDCPRFERLQERVRGAQNHQDRSLSERYG